MNRYTENAKRLLLENDSALVYCNENEVNTSDIRGVLRLVLMVKEQRLSATALTTFSKALQS